MNVRLYANTGFNSIDIPDSPELVENTFSAIFDEDNINVIQAEYIAQICVEITNDDAKAVDYCIITNDQDIKSCYTIQSFEEVAPNTIKFYLLIDPYNSLGGLKVGSGNILLSASAERLSVSINDDNTNFYTELEPFRPSERFFISYDNLNKPNDNTVVDLIETITIPPKTVELLKAQDFIDTMGTGVDFAVVDRCRKAGYLGAKIGEYGAQITQTDTNGNVKTINYCTMISPVARKLETSIFRLTKIDGTTVDIETHTRYWHTKHENIDYSVAVDTEIIDGDLIEDFRNNGKEADIINYWEIPVYFLSRYTSNKYSPLTDNASASGGHEAGGIPVLQNAVLASQLVITAPMLYNNKAKYSQNITIKIYSAVSGDYIDKKIYEIVNPTVKPNDASYLADYVITADVRPQGTPIFLFKNTNGADQTQAIAESVRGGEWRNIPLTASGISNAVLEKEKIKSKQDINQLQLHTSIGAGIAQLIAGGAMAFATGGTSLITNVLMAGGASMVAGGFGTYITNSKQQQEQQRLLEAQGEQASSQINIGSSSFVRDSGDNYFKCMITQYSVNDAISYDTFLTRFGYKVGNKKIETPDLFSRPAFNYVKINDMTIKADEKPINLINQTIEQLKAGVRLWHKAPNYNDMTAGGNR